MGTNSRNVGRKHFGIDESARLLGISPWLVRLEIARGNLCALRVGRQFVLSWIAIDGYLARREEQSLLARIQVLPGGKTS
jgi:hypothetical protein